MQDQTQQIAGDTTAQRLLNLFFIFNTSTRPLSTEEIISDSDLGYGSDSYESDMRKFRRDRAKLESLGIRIVETNPVGAAETESSFWQLDRSRTFAEGGVISPDDAQVLAEAIEEYIQGRTTPLERPLRAARNTILELVHPAQRTGSSSRTASSSEPQPQDSRHRSSRHGQEPSAPHPLLDAIWDAFTSHRLLTISYRDAQGISSKRTVAIYGIFSYEGITYFTGLDDQRGAIRTFRADRVEKAWRPKGSYEIPTSFDIRSHIFLPFDFGDGPGLMATFSLDNPVSETAAAAITHGRGDTSKESGMLTWTIEVHDIDAAASFALEHAREGLRPVAPPELVAAWDNHIERAVKTHES